MFMKKLLLLTVMIVACCSFALAQQVVTGKVTDANGMPLAGVSVSVKGGKRGTTTGPDGQFSISAAPGAVLVFTNIGFAEKEEVGENGSSNVILEPSHRSKQAEIVPGYNHETK